MQALKLCLYQTQAVYRNPVSSEVIETYPLPPPSTILGLISTLIKKPLDVGDINISIAGSFDTLVRDYQWYKKYSTTKPYPILVHILQDVKLTIHIMTYDNIELLTRIKDAFEQPPSFLYLGRAEDLIKVESIDLVNITLKKPSEFTSFVIDESTYIAEHDLKNIRDKGIPYWLATFIHPNIVTVGNGKKQESKLLRNFDWILYNYFEKIHPWKLLVTVNYIMMESDIFGGLCQIKPNKRTTNIVDTHKSCDPKCKKIRKRVSKTGVFR